MRKPKIYVLFGAPCSGKSTIGKDVAHMGNIEYISTGDIARDMAKTNKEVSNDLIQGRLAPEDFMRIAVYDRIYNKKNSVILDGFPRFQGQLEWMYTKLDNHDFVFIMVCADFNTLNERSSRRNRADDISFNRRMDFYLYETRPMIENIENLHYIHNVDGRSCVAIKEMIEIIDKEENK